MPVAVVTGSGGLVGSDSVRHFAEEGFDVVGVENHMRARFFGEEASTRRVTEGLVRSLPEFRSLELDVRDRDGVDSLFARHGPRIELVIHAAAQPSHDWAAREPHTDWEVNATGTLNLLEATRAHAPDATFVFTSTNKVYGDRPNDLPLVELGDRLDLPAGERWYDGVDTSMPIDASTHSLFGVSKTAADLMVQEYGRYFGMATACFRCGCLTGAQHAGAKLHGFLSYLMRAILTGEQYTVIGYGGKQVRDNLHSADLARAFDAFRRAPRSGAVYNLGGGRGNDCSVREAIALCERISGLSLATGYDDRPRRGDHRWWISDLGEFQTDYPDWTVDWSLEAILRDIHERNAEHWTAVR